MGAGTPLIELQFFSLEVSEEDFLAIEANAPKAEQFGLETLGVFRVPLYSR